MSEKLPNLDTPETEKLHTILDNGMNQEAEGKEINPDHIRILTEQLASGETSHFDAGFVKLLAEINENDDKSAILHSLINTGIITLRSVGSKVIGVLGAMEAGALGSGYVTHKASQFLSNRFVINPATVKAMPGHTATAVKEAAGSIAGEIDPDIVESAKQTATQMKGFFSDALKKAHDLISHSGGDDLLSSSADAAHAIKNTVAEGTALGVDSTVEGINHIIVQPAVESTSHLAGWASYIPSAAIGYFLTSGFVGGVTGVAQEMREEKSFSRFKDLINEVNSFGIYRNPEVFENDPRIKLVVEFKRISESPDKTKYHFTKEEWLQFAAATREAKCSLLRSKTRAAQIIDDEERSFQERKRGVIDSVILNTQAQLAEADRDLATKLLVQFDDRLTNEMEPLGKENMLENSFQRRVLKYSKSFVKSGINATGIPTLWRGFKASAKFTRKLVLPF